MSALDDLAIVSRTVLGSPENRAAAKRLSAALDLDQERVRNDDPVARKIAEKNAGVGTSSGKGEV